MNNEGGCDMEFTGHNALEVASKCGEHVMSSADELHESMRKKMADQMTHGTEADKQKWFEWFQGEWDKKAEA